MKKQEETNGAKPVTMSVVDVNGDNNTIKTGSNAEAGKGVEIDDKEKVKQLMQLVEKMNNQNKYLQEQLNGALNTFNFRCIEVLLKVMEQADNLDTEFNKRVAFATMSLTDNLISFLKGEQQEGVAQENKGKVSRQNKKKGE